MTENGEHAHHNFLEPNAMSLYNFFCLTNSPKKLK